MPDDDDTQEYSVVINDEEQYSIWFENREIPNGWRAVGRKGSKSECLDYIRDTWTDMRPLSLRRAMEAQQAAENPDS